MYQREPLHVVAEHLVVLGQPLLPQHVLQTDQELGEAGPEGGLGGPAGQDDLTVESLALSDVAQWLRTGQSLSSQDLVLDLLVGLCNNTAITLLTVFSLTETVRFVAEAEDLPERHPVAPDVRLDVELPGLEVLGSHPGPGDQLPLCLLVI